MKLTIKVAPAPAYPEFKDLEEGDLFIHPTAFRPDGNDIFIKKAHTDEEGNERVSVHLQSGHSMYTSQSADCIRYKIEEIVVSPL